MNYPSAIVIAAAIVAAALLLNGQGASQMSAGSFAITPDNHLGAAALVWRVDTTTGMVSLCGTDITAYNPPHCSPWGPTQSSAAPAAPPAPAAPALK
jgi:hypothetical protein